ncbi:MAG: glycosyltransferase family 4 protein [Acidimicrobiales bacterium]
MTGGERLRVCLDVTAAGAQGAGIARYVRELAMALHRLPEGPELVAFHHGRRRHALPAELEQCRGVDLPVPERLWRAAALAATVLGRRWTGGLDVFHGTDVVAVPAGRATVVTVHDLSALRQPTHVSPLNGWYLRRALPRMVRRANAVITPSEATAAAILERLDVPHEAVHVVPHGVDHDRFRPRDPEAARRRVGAELGVGAVDAGYGLAVGTLEPRKNLATVLGAWARLRPPIPLVVAGADGWGKVAVAEQAQRLGIGDLVRRTGHVPDDLLADLYAGAGLVVSVSWDEGFGFPLLEAMACGTPVVAGDRGALPEVAGGAALLVPPADVGAVAEAITAVVSDATLSARLRVAGLRRAAAFDWGQAARRTVAVYAAALAR